MLQLFPNIRYGTERYPEKVARRLRALNISTFIASITSGCFAVWQLLDVRPGVWKVGLVNAAAAISFALIPTLHRFNSLAAPLAFLALVYVDVYVLMLHAGTGTGMQWFYLAGTALAVLFLGTEHVVIAVCFNAAAVAFVIVLEATVPRDTGLQSAAVQFASFIISVAVSSTTMMIIVVYALREAARSENAAERERTRSESLLANILPAQVAERLKDRTESVIADRFDDASILFADMAGFTARASDASPDDLVHFLNGVFSDFDRLVEQHGLEKIKTTGDSYMVVSGVPAARPDHAQALAQLALDMQSAAAKMPDLHGDSVPIRIGIASGPVVAGVVGTRKFFYDVWGDAVNVASRMETTGVAGKIQIAQSVYEHLKDDFVLEARGDIDVKGKGSMKTWFLVSCKP